MPALPDLRALAERLQQHAADEAIAEKARDIYTAAAVVADWAMWRAFVHDRAGLEERRLAAALWTRAGRDDLADSCLVGLPPERRTAIDAELTPLRAARAGGSGG